jgi:hypothetical protein
MPDRGALQASVSGWRGEGKSQFFIADTQSTSDSRNIVNVASVCHFLSNELVFYRIELMSRAGGFYPVYRARRFKK